MFRLWRRPPCRIDWATVEPGLLAARKDGRVIGHVLTTAGGQFISFNRDNDPIGLFDELEKAKRSLPVD